MQSRKPSYRRAGSLWGRAAQCAALLALLLAPRLAAATPEYPTAVDITIGTECPYPNSRCLICHTTARGGQGTAAQPFALELRDYGLNRGRDAELLQAALMAMPDTQDSDRDGEPDKEELSHCGNPSGEDLGIGPEYGCDGARLSPQTDRGAAPLCATLLLALCGISFGRRARARRTP
jgi:hypothetical protein